MTGEQDTGNPARLPLAEWAEAERKFRDLIITPPHIERIERILNPPQPDYSCVLEIFQREADRERNYKNAVIELARQQAPPDPPPQAQPAQDEPATVAQGEPDKPKRGAAATRKIALAEAANVALAALRKELKREPDFEEFWAYITERDDTGTISDYTDDRLMWTGKDGRPCETAKSTMRNRLTAAKNCNPFNL